MSSLHPWHYQFGFPGFAETEWVLPADVAHDEPGYEPLPWSFAVHDLEAWRLDPRLERALRALHAETFGGLADAADGRLDAVLDALRCAFERGELVVWARAVRAMQRPAVVTSTPNPGVGTVTRTAWFEVVVLDEMGIPLANAELEVDVGEGRTKRTTDGGGRVRIDGAPGVTGTARFSDEGPIRAALAERWGSVRGPRRLRLEDVDPATEIEVLSSTPLGGARLRSEEVHTIVLTPRVSEATLHGPWFDRGKAFILPSALDGVRYIVDRAREHPGADALIVGHTDRTVDEPGGGELSHDRARTVAAMLRADAADWLAFYGDDRPEQRRWGRREDELMVEAVARQRGEVIPFGVSVEAWYADARGQTVAQFDTLRPRLIADYMSAPGTTLPRGTTVLAHGCGRAFPLDPEALEGGRAHRRMQLFLFERPLAAPSAESGVLPPPPGEVAMMGSRVHPEWILRSRRRTEHFVGPPSPMKCHISLLARSNSGRVFVADRHFKLHSGDGRVFEGKTNENGLVIVPCVDPRDYLLEIDDVQSYVPAIPLHWEHRVTRLPSYFIHNGESAKKSPGR